VDVLLGGGGGARVLTALGADLLLVTGVLVTTLLATEAEAGKLEVRLVAGCIRLWGHVRILPLL
jgi:hypothetical protein